MKNYLIILIGLTAFLITACWTTEQANQTPNAANTANTINAANTTNQAAVETKPALSPTETLRSLNEASKQKNPAEIKSYLSQGTLALLDESAARQKKQVDELLREEGAAPFYELPKILGEKVEGDTAVVEIENTATNEVEKIPFVKENGKWKVAIDVYLKNLENEFNQEKRQ